MVRLSEHGLAVSVTAGYVTLRVPLLLSASDSDIAYGDQSAGQPQTAGENTRFWTQEPMTASASISFVTLKHRGGGGSRTSLVAAPHHKPR